VLAFDPTWLQTIAIYVPLYYGRHALEMALFYQSSDQLGRDVAMSRCWPVRPCSR
jgi:ABC-2 type transport system permease protein